MRRAPGNLGVQEFAGPPPPCPILRLRILLSSSQDALRPRPSVPVRAVHRFSFAALPLLCQTLGLVFNTICPTRGGRPSVPPGDLRLPRRDLSGLLAPLSLSLPFPGLPGPLNERQGTPRDSRATAHTDPCLTLLLHFVPGTTGGSLGSWGPGIMSVWVTPGSGVLVAIRLPSGPTPKPHPGALLSGAALTGSTLAGCS